MSTIKELVAVVNEINTANGWRENKGVVLTEETPEAQIAATASVSGHVAGVIEAIRKPSHADAVSKAMDGMQMSTGLVHHMGIEDHTGWYLKYVTRELGEPLHGSKTLAICRARLFDTESEELIQAILEGDVAKIADELADTIIRPLDFVGAWNEDHPDQPIDLEAAILAKLERNRNRGYRHGGKLA